MRERFDCVCLIYFSFIHFFICYIVVPSKTNIEDLELFNLQDEQTTSMEKTIVSGGSLVIYFSSLIYGTLFTHFTLYVK